MSSEDKDNSTVGELLEAFDIIVYKILQRLKHEFNLKDKNNLDVLFKPHVNKRYLREYHFSLYFREFIEMPFNFK